MKLTCPNCHRPFIGRAVNVQGNAENISIYGNKIIEICNHCGHEYHPKINGIYNFVDGVPILIKELNELGLPLEDKKKINNLNFSSIQNFESLLNSIKPISDKIFSLVKKWFRKGIAFSLVILALNQYSCNFNSNFNESIANQVKTAVFIPDSVKVSYLKSYLPKRDSIQSIDPNTLKKRSNK